MLYKWFHNEVSKEIEDITRKKIKCFTSGAIKTGEYENGIPLVRRGIAIEFETELTVDDLNKVDVILTDFKRAGGISISQEIEKLKEAQ